MRKNTILGLLAIILWSTNVAFSRSLAEDMGFLTSGSTMYIIGGLLGAFFGKFRPFNRQAWGRISKKYLFICGALFVVNTIVFQIALGLAVTRDQILIVGLINYLWTVFSLIFSVWILKNKTKPFLLGLGISLALVGIWLASTQGQAVNFLQPGLINRSLIVYGLAFLAAITWGFYSSLSRLWEADGENDGLVPYFLLFAGLLMALARLLIAENTTMSLSTGLQLLYMVIFPTILAYVFWDSGVRKGNIFLVTSMSYFIPLFSTLWSSLVLNVKLTSSIGVAVFLVIAGAYLSNTAIKDQHQPNLIGEIVYDNNNIETH